MSKLNPKQAEEEKWEDFEQKSKKVETENHFQQEILFMKIWISKNKVKEFRGMHHFSTRRTKIWITTLKKEIWIFTSQKLLKFKLTYKPPH